MIQFEDIELALATGLRAALGIKVIDLNPSAEAPKYPFLTYDVAMPFDETIGHPVKTAEVNTITLSETALFMVSIQAYAKTKEEARTYALRARDWFIGSGHDILKDGVGIVVVTIGQVDNREVQVGDEWERKFGFDVDFRTTNTIVMNGQSTIEATNIKEVDPIA
jgi:hypothetical protein